MAEEQHEKIDLDKESQLFPQNNTEGSADDSDDTGATDQKLGQGPDKQGQPATDDKAGQAPTQEPKIGEGEEKKDAEAPPAFDPAALKVPDGLTTDKALVQDFGKLVNDMKLSQEQAQELVDLQVKALQAQEAQFLEVRETWVNELKNDPKYGGEHFNATVQDAGAVIARFDDSGEVLNTLVASGFGDNPAIIKMLANIRRAIGDHEFVSVAEKATNKKSLNERLWPDEVMGV